LTALNYKDATSKENDMPIRHQNASEKQCKNETSSFKHASASRKHLPVTSMLGVI
jgi:hypothetical protein